MRDEPPQPRLPSCRFNHQLQNGSFLSGHLRSKIPANGPRTRTRTAVFSRGRLRRHALLPWFSKRGVSRRHRRREEIVEQPERAVRRCRPPRLPLLLRRTGPRRSGCPLLKTMATGHPPPEVAAAIRAGMMTMPTQWSIYLCWRLKAADQTRAREVAP